MRLYVIEAGILRSDKGFFVLGTDGTKFDVPVPYFLIEHEKGYVLFDSGHNAATLQDPSIALHPTIYNAHRPEPHKDGYVLSALKKLGVKPEDVVYNVCSHLHFDHAGGVGLFPNAKYVLQREEMNFAFAPDEVMEHVYVREDFDKDVNWLLLDGWNDNEYDLFGDGKLIIYFTPGHTPGHQSLLVNVSTPMMLTGDACYTTYNLDNMEAGFSCDSEAYVQNLRVFKDLQKKGVTIVTGHDPDAWLSIKKSPEFYE